MNQLMTKNIIPPRTPIAVVRLDTLEHVVPMTRALARGGITRVEMTLTSERALEAVSQVQRELQGEVVIGMGTVLDGEGARASLDAGAAFLVTPIVAPEVIAVGHSHNVPVLCGAFTPTEIVAAWRAGADFIKVFPAGRLGPAYLKDILAPLPDLLLVPTGGVTLENCRAFLEAGAYTVGVGGQLVNTELIARQDWSALTTRARQFAQACVP